MNNPIFKHVAVLMGGISDEREISLCSGKAVANGLRLTGREVFEIDVQNSNFTLPARTDAVFIALHGEFGEDGQIQSILEERKIPYTGSGPRSSKLAFNKVLAKQLFFKHNIPTPDYEVLRPGQSRSIRLPAVVKPIRHGSSIGVHIVTNTSDWNNAFEDAISYNNEVIVESYIDGKELTVGVICSQVLPVIEIRAPGNNYNYLAKYTKDATQYIVPAELDEESACMCQGFAFKAFKALGCRGFGRADMRMSKDGSIYVLELNTIPGFTATSLLPKAAAAADCGFSNLCDRIIQAATLDSITLQAQHAETKNVV